MTTPELIAELERLDAAATKGPWCVIKYDTIEESRENQEFTWAEIEWWNAHICERGKPSMVFRDCGNGSHTGLPGSIETSEPNADLIAFLGTHRYRLLLALRREAEAVKLLKEAAQTMRISEYAGERMLAGCIDAFLKETA